MERCACHEKHQPSAGCYAPKTLQSLAGMRADDDNKSKKPTLSISICDSRLDP